ncbi:MAG: WD40 repeat domain-containing protein, partial [Chloroflexi bacterium]
LTIVYVVIVAALAVFALWQAVTAENRRQEAVAAQATAQYNAQQAQSLALASNAQRLLFRDNNIPLAIAIALEANKIDQPPALAQSVLAQAAFAPGQRFVLSGYADYGARLALSPDGVHALVPDTDGNIALIDLPTQQALTTYDMGGATVWGVSFLPDAEHFIVALSDGTLGVYDVATGEEQNRITIIEAGDLSAEQSYMDLWSLGVSDDGRFVAAGAQEGVLKVVDLTTNEVRRLEGHADAIWGLDFDATAERLLSSSEDGSIILWDVSSGEVINRCHPNPDSDEYNAAWDVVFTPNGQQALVGYEDFSMRLWDLENCQLIHRFVGHTNRIWSVDVSPDGKLALSASYDSVVRLWDVKSGEVLRPYFGHDSAVFDAEFTSDGLHFLSLGGDTTLRYWDIENGAEEMRVKPHAARITTVLTLDDNQVISVSHDGTVKITDVTTGDVQALPVNFSAVYAAAMSPDGQYLLIGGDAADESAPNLILWNFSTEEAIELKGHSDGVYAVTFSADGQFAFSGGDDTQIIQWNVADGTQVNVFNGAESRIRSLATNPDGTQLAAGETDNLVRIWDVATQEQLHALDHSGVVYHVAFNSDGVHLLTTSEDRSIRIWDTETYTLASRLDGHNLDVFDAEFSPDESLIASASLDGTIRVWDVARSAEVQLLSGHQGGVTAIVFSADGKRLFSGGVDGTVRVWSLKTPEEILAWLNAGNRTVPELTCEQRAQYFIEPLCEGHSD